MLVLGASSSRFYRKIFLCLRLLQLVFPLLDAAVLATERKELLFVINHLGAAQAGERIILQQENRLFGADLLAVAAVNAAQHVDFKFERHLFRIRPVSHWPGRSRRNDFDGLRRTDKFTELAAHALGVAVLVANEIRRAAIIRRHGPFLFRVFHSNGFAAEQRADGVADRNFESADNRRQIKSLPKRQRFAINNHLTLIHSTTAVTRMFASASGTNRRQPRSINWSYRKRGNIQRTQMNNTMNNSIFTRKIKICARPVTRLAAGWSSPQNGSVQPPKNSVTIIAADAIMLEYSPRKNS